MPFSCMTCGDTWAKHPATVVACPSCYQPEGSPCKRPSGHDFPGGNVHVAREALAVSTGLLHMCKEGPTANGKVEAKLFQ